MKGIETLTPVEVSKKFLHPNNTNGKVDDDFNLFRIEEITPLLSLPTVPFRNTAHGFICLTNGKMKMLFNQEEFVLSSGTIILTPAGQMNSFTNISSSVKGFFGTFNDNFLLQNSNNIGINIVEDFLTPEQMPHFELNEKFVFMASIFKKLYQLHESNSANSRLLKQQYLLTVLLELKSIYFQRSKSQKSKSDKLIYQFKKLLLQEVQKNPTPKSLAIQLHVSTNHLNKILKQKTKLTTSQWIVKQRIAEAKYLLHYSHNTIAEIAYQLGFSEPSHFTKYFKKHTNILPSEFSK